MFEINAHIKLGQLFTAGRLEKEFRFYRVDKFLVYEGIHPITSKPRFSTVLSYKNATHLYDQTYNLCFDKDLVSLLSEN